MATSRKTRAIVGLTFSASALIGMATTANAQPREEIFDANDQTWLCHSDGFPAPSHCENIRSKGRTGIILVFAPDERGPSEGIGDASADTRPCPHDPGSPDGTWWEVVPGTYVCHHQP